jgi:GTP-binding protein
LHKVEDLSIIHNATFVGSFPRADDCPKGQLPEYAFIGRSNVGKSSLVNMITGRKGLAKISSTPGKTQSLNFFLINQHWHLVDLPGYGYARVSKTSREQWSKMIRHYLHKREQLRCLFVLIDSCIGPQEIDMTFLKTLGQQGIPFAIVYTKTDKDTQQNIQKNIQAFRKRFLQDWKMMPNEFETSSSKGRGRDEILDFIESLNTEAP